MIRQQICFTGARVADALNEFFTMVAGNLVAELLSSAGSDLEKDTQKFYVAKGVTADSVSFTVVREDTVLKVLKTMGRTRSLGWIHFLQNLLLTWL